LPAVGVVVPGVQGNQNDTLPFGQGAQGVVVVVAHDKDVVERLRFRNLGVDPEGPGVGRERRLIP
jgi:hypothetical protein